MCRILIHRGFITAVIVAVMVEKPGKQDMGEKKQDRKPWTLREFGGKPVWDWLELLLVPLLLGIIAAGLTAWFNAHQDSRQNDIEDRRAQAERDLAEQRAQDEALQAYLDQMSTLLTEKNLRNSREDSTVRKLARARTLTVLQILDPSGKNAVMNFLLEAGLVQGEEGEPIINLFGAQLSGIRMVNTDLSGAVLSQANLNDAVLVQCDLSDADLSSAALFGANLTGTDLRDANLLLANMHTKHRIIIDTTDANPRSRAAVEEKLGLKTLRTRPN